MISYHCPVAATASYWAAQRIPTWRYVFSGYFKETIPYSWMRPFHGADTELVFGLLPSVAYQDPGPEVQKAGKYLQDAVGAFVRDPVHGLEKFGWKPYNPDGKFQFLLEWIKPDDLQSYDTRKSLWQQLR